MQCCCLAGLWIPSSSTMFVFPALISPRAAPSALLNSRNPGGASARTRILHMFAKVIFQALLFPRISPLLGLITAILERNRKVTKG